MQQDRDILEQWLTLTSHPIDRTGGELILKTIRGIYKITIENKITDYYDVLFTTTKTALARHCFETVYHAIADDELKATSTISPIRDHSNAIASELSIGLK